MTLTLIVQEVKIAYHEDGIVYTLQGGKTTITTVIHKNDRPSWKVGDHVTVEISP